MRTTMMLIGDYEARAIAETAGVVRYEGTHVVLPRRAMIELVAEDAPKAAGVRLLRQACIVEALRDADVRRIYECGRLDSRPWVAFEAIDGVTLETELESRALEIRELVDLIEQIAKTLCHAHARGVLHRDVSPATIVCARDRNRFVLDGWTNACTVDTELAPPLRVTNRYQAPEVEQDMTADVYGLGMTALHALAGPHAILTEQPRVHVPKPLTSLLAAMVSEHAMNRPSAAEIVTAIGALRTALVQPTQPIEQPAMSYDPSLEVDIEFALDAIDELDEPVLLDRRTKPRWTPQPDVDQLPILEGITPAARSTKN